MHNLYKQKDLPYLNVKACPKCEKLVLKEATTCDNCHFDFILNKVVDKSNETILSDEPFLYCDNCGEKVLLKNKYCSHCGSKLTKTICPNCNTILDNSLSFCNKCGKKLSNDEQELDSYKPFDKEIDLEKVELKTNNIEEKKVKTFKVEVKNEPKKIDEIENLLSLPHEEIVNVPRKRVFLILQIVLAIFAILVALFVPILSKDSFFKMINGLINDSYTSNDLLMNGLDYLKFFFSFLKDGFNINIINNIYDKLAIDCYFLNTGVDIISKIFALIFNGENSEVIIMFIVLGTIYLFYFGSSICLLIFSILSMFNTTPLKDKSLLALIASELLAILIIYPNTFFNSFKGFDCYFIYLFFISILVWVLNRFFFAKEEQIYKKKYDMEFERKY